jgi:hypothetical protein
MAIMECSIYLNIRINLSISINNTTWPVISHKLSHNNNNTRIFFLEFSSKAFRHPPRQVPSRFPILSHRRTTTNRFIRSTSNRCLCNHKLFIRSMATTRMVLKSVKTGLKKNKAPLAVFHPQTYTRSSMKSLPSTTNHFLRSSLRNRSCLRCSQPPLNHWQNERPSLLLIVQITEVYV